MANCKSFCVFIITFINFLEIINRAKQTSNIQKTEASDESYMLYINAKRMLIEDLFIIVSRLFLILKMVIHKKNEFFLGILLFSFHVLIMSAAKNILCEYRIKYDNLIFLYEFVFLIVLYILWIQIRGIEIVSYKKFTFLTLEQHSFNIITRYTSALRIFIYTLHVSRFNRVIDEHGDMTSAINSLTLIIAGIFIFAKCRNVLVFLCISIFSYVFMSVNVIYETFVVIPKLSSLYKFNSLLFIFYGTIFVILRIREYKKQKIGNKKKNNP